MGNTPRLSVQVSLRFNRVRGYITREPSIAGAETGWCFAGSRKKADSQLAAFFLAQEGGRRSEVIKEHLSSLLSRSSRKSVTLKRNGGQGI